MTKTMEIYANYGCLAAEKRNVYTYGVPASTAVCSDKLIVKVPDGWKLCESQDGREILESPWGYCYTPNEVLAGNENPIFWAYDQNMREHRVKLEIVGQEEEE